MERIVIITIVLTSIALLAWRLFRIVKEDNSSCLGCASSGKKTCPCGMVAKEGSGLIKGMWRWIRVRCLRSIFALR